MLKGIDVSYANNKIDWSKASKEVDFAIIRCGFGSESPDQADGLYRNNANGCTKYNVPFGIYHFAYCVNSEAAKQEADFAIKLAKEYKGCKFIAYDIEEDTLRYCRQQGVVHTRASLTACAKAFLERVKSAGYTPVLYANYDYINNRYNYSELSKYYLWLAYPGASSAGRDCGIWQYSWTGKVNGISGNVDMNCMYDDIIGKPDNKVNKKPKNSPEKHIYYQVYSDGRWLPWVADVKDYAGLECKAISGIRMKVDGGHIIYRVKLVGSNNYLPWVTDYNTSDDNGYAGILGRNIDCVQAYLENLTDYDVEYRVSTGKNTDYLPWVQNYNNKDDNGYAGVNGVSIDKFQARVVKK